MTIGSRAALRSDRAAWRVADRLRCYVPSAADLDIAVCRRLHAS